jgi:hypothetical protein
MRPEALPSMSIRIRIRIRIRVLDPYRASLGARAAPPDYHFLDARQLSTEERERFPFIANWTDHFDYLLVLTPRAREMWIGIYRTRLKSTIEKVLLRCFESGIPGRACARRPPSNCKALLFVCCAPRTYGQ